MTQLDILIEIFKENNRPLTYPEIYENYALKTGIKELTKGQMGGIRKNIQIHCKDCASFCGKEIFKPTYELGKGTWELM